MKFRKFTSLIILVSVLYIYTSMLFPLAGAKVTKSQFTGNTTWAGGGDYIDRIAGKTTHRRNRITYFTITSENNFLDETTLLRIVNFNRNVHRNVVQRWGKFSIIYNEVVLWKGSWSGYRESDGERVEKFVGHGVREDLIGFKIKFTMAELDPETPGLNIFGVIMNINK